MGHPSSPRLLVLHALRLKGVASDDAIADHTGLPAGEVGAELDHLTESDLARPRHGRIAGHALTPEGRALDDRLLAAELDETGSRATVEAAYTDFLGFNDRLIAVCTAWQLREMNGERVVNDHSDPDYDADVHARLLELHAKVDAVLEDLTVVLDRFAGHRTRLRNALDHVLAGEHDWFTKPLFPSYHSVWFELHEDLLATLGRERSAETAPTPTPPSGGGTADRSN